MQPAHHQPPVPPQVSNDQVIQRFYISNIDGTDYQFADDIELGVSVADAQHFYAGPNVPVALKVLNLEHTFEETGNRIFTINVDYVQDCGYYALEVMNKIIKGTYDTEKFRLGKKTIKDDSPQPGIGEAFYVKSVDDPKSGLGKPHFNHHYGVVVAKSGNDVITAEADSTKTQMAFHMYNTVNFGQSFKDVYVTKGKLAETAESALYTNELRPRNKN